MQWTIVQIISSLLGWTYMLCWAASFYPQLILNIRRKTTMGFSIDFALLNILGMASYAVYNVALYSWPNIRHEYAQHYPSHPVPPVELNDIVYAIHGAILTAIIYSQFYPAVWGFTQIKGLKCNRWSLSLFWCCNAAVLLAVLFVFVEPDSMGWSLLNVIFLLGNVKSFLTLVKYAPQTWLNFQRKSTQGLSILQFSLDLTGGVLSLAQLLLDSASTGNWSAVFANPAKLALGNITVLFDLVFFYQHMVLYRGARKASLPDRLDGETDPLLRTRGIGVYVSVEAGDC